MNSLCAEFATAATLGGCTLVNTVAAGSVPASVPRDPRHPCVPLSTGGAKYICKRLEQGTARGGGEGLSVGAAAARQGSARSQSAFESCTPAKIELA